MRKLTVLIGFVIFFSCKKENNSVLKLYKLVKAEASGIHFNNSLIENDSINYFTYPYIYMGGGVSIGDINNDGLQDIFFTGNMVSNKLYLNKGGLKFEDITEKAGLNKVNKWCTGVTMADVNADGYLDIYVSTSGLENWDKKNSLFINNGNLSFSEEAEKRGISDIGHSTQTTFFDYDNDGDLDAYIANYPPANFTSSNDYYKHEMENISLEKSDKLYENNGAGFFEDVTIKAGLLSYGLSLSATIGDFNNDGWQDIYVSNDFSTPDYFYFNNGDGTFKDHLKSVTNHTSFYGMGVDIADFNNDGLLDFFQVDMTPEDNYRSKSNMVSMDVNNFWDVVNKGFHFQYMQNSVQVNNGIRENGLPFFSDIARFSGMAMTDWSWSPLILDMNNDGWKDVFITNGSRRDINNKDYFKKIDKLSAQTKGLDLLIMSKEIPSSKISNYAFLNSKNLQFIKVSAGVGLDYEGFSNGSAYGDLDNDGDLDLVINNIDSIAMIFENRANLKSNNTYLRFKATGPTLNKFGIGVKISINTGTQTQFQELTLTRGFQSSVEPIVHFGTANAERVDKVLIKWPDGKQQILNSVKTNQVITIDYKNASIVSPVKDKTKKSLFTEDFSRTDLEYKHIENNTDDFIIQPLLPHKLSELGPEIEVGDVNNDGLDDFFIGGASGKAGEMFVQQQDGQFTKIEGPWTEDFVYEDMGVLLFDADADADLDLYIVSGGNNIALTGKYQDRLYINNGKALFTKAHNGLPKMNTSGSCVVANDFDNDGDLDLFIGGRLVPHKYPLAPRSYLLQNNSTREQISFTDVTEEIAPELMNLGMVTAALWLNTDLDKEDELVLVGEWLPITVFDKQQTKFKNVTLDYGLENTTGWWSSLLAEDFDNDGDIDIVAGNLGLNYKYQATEKASFDIYAYDYDQNNRLDIVLGYYYKGEQYPVRGRQCSAEQIPAIQYKYKDYNAFAGATLEDVYSKSNLKASLHYQAKNFASSYLENLGNGKFGIKNLPNKAQFSSINNILAKDFNKDGFLDILTTGNLFSSEIETPRNDASIGNLLTGDGHGNFTAMPFEKSGFFTPNNAKSSAIISTKLGDFILVSNNNDVLQVFSVN